MIKSNMCCIGLGVGLSAMILFAGCTCPFDCRHNHSNNQEQTAAQSTQQTTTKSTIQQPAKLTTITSVEQFEAEVFKSTTPVIVDFSADWCGACKASKPTFDAVATQLGATYKFVVVDVDKAEKVAENLGIQGIPTFIFFKDGKEVHRITGAIKKKEDFVSTIERTFGK